MYNKKQLVFISLFLFLLLPPKIYAAIVINEIMPNPAGEDKELEWVELYNTDRTQTTIDGYVLEDKNGKRIILSGSFNDWFVVYPKNEHGFALTNTGSTIKLFTASGSSEPIDSFSYIDSDDNDSWGRIPDGIGTIQLVQATRGSGNAPPPVPTPSPTPIPKPSPTPRKTALPAVKTETASSVPQPSVLRVQPAPSVEFFNTSEVIEEEKESGESGIVLSAKDSIDESFPKPKSIETISSRNIRAPVLFSFAGAFLVMGGCAMGWMQYKRHSLV